MKLGLLFGTLLGFLPALVARADTLQYAGTDAQQKACSVTVSSSGEDITAIELNGVFKVTYTVPSPGSGLFGDYYIPGTFTSDVNFADGFSRRKRLFDPGQILSGPGKPIFYDEPQVTHQITTTGDVDSLSAVSYSSSDQLLVLVNLQCSGLTRQ